MRVTTRTYSVPGYPSHQHILVVARFRRPYAWVNRLSLWLTRHLLNGQREFVVIEEHFLAHLAPFLS